MTLTTIVPGRRIARAAVALALATGGGLLATATAARGDMAYTAVASADSIRIVTDLTGFPATRTPVDSAGPTSRATLSSSGGGTAYSAAPDPGEFLSSGPGLGAGIVAQNVPGGLPFAVPGYPLVAYADAQNPTATIGAGGYKLDAAVGADDATATTSTGATTPAGDVVVTNSVAKVTNAGGKVAALGTSRTEGLTIGPLSLGVVQSRASVLSDAAGQLTKTSQFQVDGASFGNIPIRLTPDGFSIAGSAVPASGASLSQALAANGITVSQVPQTVTPTGVSGAGLLITQKLPFQTFGQTTLIYRLGGASANIDTEGAGGVLASSPGAAVAPGVPPTAVTAGTDPIAPTPADGDLPAVSMSNSANRSPTGTVPARPTAALNLVSGSRPVVPDLDDRGLCLALVLAGLLGTAAMALIGARGVKSR